MLFPFEVSESCVRASGPINDFKETAVKGSGRLQTKLPHKSIPTKLSLIKITLEEFYTPALRDCELTGFIVQSLNLS